MPPKRWTSAELLELASTPFDTAETRDAVRAALIYAAKMLDAADAVVRESQRRTRTVDVAPAQAPSEAHANITALLVAHRDMITAQSMDDRVAEVEAVARMEQHRAALAAGVPPTQGGNDGR